MKNNYVTEYKMLSGSVQHVEDKLNELPANWSVLSMTTTEAWKKPVHTVLLSKTTMVKKPTEVKGGKDE